VADMANRNRRLPKAHGHRMSRRPVTPRVSETPRRMSQPQAELLFQCRVAKLPRPKVEWRFHPKRLWRFDLAFTAPVYQGSILGFRDIRLAVEIDGGGFVNGRHSRGKGIEGDCEKYAEAMLLGWRVLRVTPAQVKSGDALRWITALLT
jgi:hypothetical protein